MNGVPDKQKYDINIDNGLKINISKITEVDRPQVQRQLSPILRRQPSLPLQVPGPQQRQSSLVGAQCGFIGSDAGSLFIHQTQSAAPETSLLDRNGIPLYTVTQQASHSVYRQRNDSFQSNDGANFAAGSLRSVILSPFKSTQLVSATKMQASAFYMTMPQLMAIFFAVFINLLDACTFGTVFFPTQLIERDSSLMGLGILTFILSTVVVQFVFCCTSGFRTGLGTAMAENIPFIHTMALGIVSFMGNDKPIHEVIPTVVVCISLSTIFNGIVFYVIGSLKLGELLHFFPQHVIVGCIGGFGVFLFETAISISIGQDFAWKYDFLKYLVSGKIVWNWVVVAILEVLLRLFEFIPDSQKLVPYFMMLPPVLFYAVLYVFKIDIETARDHIWLFEKSPPSNFTDLWVHFDFSLVDWGAIVNQFPIMLSLAIFTILMVPIRIPTLNLALNEEADFNSEIKAHGYANIISGLLGSVHNYISFSNSVFYYDCGGAECGLKGQFLTGVVTLSFFFVGPSLVDYVPRCIAGLVMMHLGIDLLQRAIVSSFHMLDRFEYCTVVLITLAIAGWGFVTGIYVGGVLTCATFVLQSSRYSTVRAIYGGETAKSNTEWTGKSRLKLSAGNRKYINVVQLQGYLFFGNVQQVLRICESLVSDLSEKPIISTTSNQPFYRRFLSRSSANGRLSSKVDSIFPRSYSSLDSSNEEIALKTLSSHDEFQLQKQFLVMDFSFVTGMDSSASTSMWKMVSDMKTEWQPSVQIKFAGIEEMILYNFKSSRPDDQKGLVDDDLLIFQDVNSALRSCEESIIEDAPTPEIKPKRSKKDSIRNRNNMSISDKAKVELPGIDINVFGDLELWTARIDEHFLEAPLEEMDTDVVKHKNLLPIDDTNDDATKKEKVKGIQKCIRKMLIDQLGRDASENEWTAMKRLSGYFINNIRRVHSGQVLWKEDTNARTCCLLVDGILNAVHIDDDPAKSKVLQVVQAGGFVGELGLLCHSKHTRTIVVPQGCDATVAYLTSNDLEYIYESDHEVLILLQIFALHTAARRSEELRLFNAAKHSSNRMVKSTSQSRLQGSSTK